MKGLIINLLIVLIVVTSFIMSCKKENPASISPEASIQLNALILNYKSTLNDDLLLVNFHQHAGLGNHDSCFYYWQQFNKNDSLYSLHFYEYCRIIYANNGGRKYGNSDWNWNMGDYGMMGGNDSNGMMGGNGNNGMMNSDYWQCGLDTLQFQYWNGSGDFQRHDSLMQNMMENYGMVGYFSNQANQCFANMQSLRIEHYGSHNYHW